LTEYEWRNQTSTKKKGANSEVGHRVAEDMKSRCRIYFPLRETVQTSKGGMDVSDCKVLSSSRSSQANQVPGRWNHLLSTQILGFEYLSAATHAGLQKPKKGLVDAQQDDVCEVRERRFRRQRRLGVCWKS
jgi:hypothetical protein